MQGDRERADTKPYDRTLVRYLVRNTTTIWQRVSVEDLVKRSLGDRADWRKQLSLIILIGRSAYLQFRGLPAIER